MSTTTLPPIHTLPTLPSPTLTAILDTLFEPSPTLHTLSLPLLQNKSPFPSYPSLIAQIGNQLYSLAKEGENDDDVDDDDKAKLHNILGSHPRLGAKKVDSAQSGAEQAQLRGGGKEEAEMLERLNAEYESAFPGLRYVVFVNGRSRPVIMENMRSRIARGDIKEEEREAIKAMCEIAMDRAAKLAG